MLSTFIPPRVVLNLYDCETLTTIKVNTTKVNGSKVLHNISCARPKKVSHYKIQMDSKFQLQVKKEVLKKSENKMKKH